MWLSKVGLSCKSLTGKLMNIFLVFNNSLGLVCVVKFRNRILKTKDTCNTIKIKICKVGFTFSKTLVTISKLKVDRYC